MIKSGCLNNNQSFSCVLECVGDVKANFDKQFLRALNNHLKDIQAELKSVENRKIKKFSTKILWKLGEYELKHLKAVLQNSFDAIKCSKVPSNCLFIQMTKQSTCKVYHFCKLFLPLAKIR